MVVGGSFDVVFVWLVEVGEFCGEGVVVFGFFWDWVVGELYVCVGG